jgi:hypothetical protein
MNSATFLRNLAEVFEGMALAGHRRQVRSDAIELQDLFLLMCFMDALGLPNPAALYLIDVHPFLVDEFHLWHRRMGADRSPLSTIACC